MSSERGYTLPELMIGMLMGIIVIIAAMTLLTVANSSSARTAARIDANQQARPVMDRIMDELRSTCLTRESVPILTGSSETTISFLNQTGETVSPVPDKHTITYAAGPPGTLTERVYAATTQNADGTWNFQSSPAMTRVLLTDVAQATVDGATVPVFRYYAYGTNGVLATAPLSAPAGTGLSATDAAKTVQVTVAFAVNPQNNGTNDVKAEANISSSALLRFGPPSELSTGSNLPCT